MQRRRYLTAIASASSITIVGCLGGGDRASKGEETLTPRNVGESVTYGGLEISVTETETAQQLTTADGSDADQQRDVITPEQGAIFALAYIRIENVGDTEISYPERGGDIQMIYRDQDASNEYVAGALGIGSEQESIYSDSVYKKSADTGAYPGTIAEGWTVFEVPEDFEQSDAFVSIRYSDTSADGRTFRWDFTAEGSPIIAPSPSPPEPDPWEVTRQVGESVTYEGVEMAVTDYETAPTFIELGNSDSNHDNDETYEVNPGSIYLFIEVEVTNVRDGRVSVPIAGSSYASEIVVVQDEREILGISIDNGAGIVFNESERTVYDGPSSRTNDLINPGETVQGWLVYSVPENFDPEATRVVIVQGSGEIDIDFQDFEWVIG